MPLPAAAPTRIFFNSDISYRLTAEDRAGLDAVCPGVQITEFNDGDSAGLRNADVLVTDLRVPSELSACPSLKWLQLVSAGANQVTRHPIAETPIPVTTASGLHGVPIAQFVTGNLLMLIHHLPELAVAQGERRWPADRWSLRGTLLRGQTAGVLGYGSIGRECARQLHALGMRIVALDPGPRRDDGYTAWPGTGDAEGRLPEAWFQPAQLREMLACCDVLVVAAPLTPRTEGMIGPEELALLRPGAHVIIISRGGIVQERALSDALKAGTLAGAAVDCYVEEPPAPDHFLYGTPRLIMTPHLAGAFEGFWPAMMTLFKENLRRFHRGEPLLNQANKRLGY
ncbi:MAG: Phosphoglycerate dehydrogenase [Verrucomicrobia bacterium]|nr:Phosphoglycerate dehydrogenase [Verrucomicrobiota bacterium]